jgi:hypothetical protein
LTIFLKFHDLWVIFKGWEFWNEFLFQEKSISTLISWNVRLFWILSFAKDVLLQKLDCVFVLAIRGLLHMIKNFVLWCDFCVLITVTESFWKVSLKEVMVLSKTCVRFRNRIFKRFEWVLIKLSFFPWLLGKKICSPLWKKFGDFSILGIDFWVKPLERS